MKKNNPLVSIIIPCFNCRDYISATLKSVLAQTYQSFEVILIDDFSTDDTKKILKQLTSINPKFSLISLNKNSGGPAHPRNIGLNKAKGDYIAFLDSDDIWHPRKLEIQIRRMLALNLDFSSTSKKRFSREDEIKIKQINKVEHFLNIDHSILLGKNIINNSSVVANKRLFKGMHFKEGQEYSAIEDFEMWLRIHRDQLACSEKILTPLLYYRVAPISISNSKCKMLKRNYKLYSEYEINGKKLGVKKFYYLFIYFYRSLYSVF